MSTKFWQTSFLNTMLSVIKYCCYLCTLIMVDWMGKKNYCASQYCRIFNFCILVFIFSPILVIGQRQIEAHRKLNHIKIDGFLDEPEWQQAQEVNGFTQIEPDAGAAATLDTRVRVMYDDNALYIGAFCYGTPEQISKVLSQRDRFNANVDYFSVLLDTYHDKLNGFVFSVSTVGVQYDAKIYSGTYNSRLDMIWYAEVQHFDDGYSVEMKIPYNAIRFAPKEIQKWGINFTRYHSLNREESSWNSIKPDLDNIVTQAGILTGIQNILPPVRLFLSPYVSTYADHFPTTSAEFNDWSYSFNGGMDIKYGINEAYTLDMTLIPDFGQVVTDNVILNLSPFEVWFQENRPFFNEGIELFEKTGHFYSRRVGFDVVNRRNAQNSLLPNEKIVSNPNITQLINASKVSGRGRNGLGIGVFNGVSAPQYAVLEDTISSLQRNIETAPLSNYNVLVLDQNLKNNSSVTFTNTNVWRSGETYDANVSSFASQLNTPDNAYFLRGDYSLSQRFHQSGNRFGHAYGVGLGKQTGNFVYSMNYLEQDDTYDPNDLGFLLVNNRRDVSKRVAYNIYKPFWKLNRLWSSFTNTYQRLHTPDVFTALHYNASLGVTNRKFHSASASFFGTYTESYDYFEPRDPMLNNFFIRPVRFGGSAGISSNYQRPFALDANLSYTNHLIPGWNDFRYTISPRIRIGNNYFIVYRWEDVWNNSERGYAIPFNSVDGQQVGQYNRLFVERDVRTTTQTIDFEWTMTNKAGITLRLRHYWSRVTANQFFDLQNNGRLEPVELSNEERFNPNQDPIYNTNFNFFSVDLVYRWIFSPASELTIVWKNNIEANNSNTQLLYLDNFRQTLVANQLNSFSVRMVYFVDYLDLKKFWQRNHTLPDANL